MIWHRMPLKQFDAFLFAQVPYYTTDLFSYFPIYCLVSIFRYKYYMVFNVVDLRVENVFLSCNII